MLGVPFGLLPSFNCHKDVFETARAMSGDLATQAAASVPTQGTPLGFHAQHRSGESQFGGTESTAVETELPNLDFLRVWAVLLVLLSHLQFIFQWQDIRGPFHFWYLGKCGVLMFFFHTSLVLT